MKDKVLVVTGGMVATKSTSVLHELWKQLSSIRESDGAWLDVQAKLAVIESNLARVLYMRSRRFARASYTRTVERFFGDQINFNTPTLTEVVLATLLEREGFPYETATFAELYADRQLRERLVAECRCVFASTTLLRDLTELEVVCDGLKRPGNHVIAGGSLVSMVAPTWAGSETIDLLAVGYGERLVPALAEWIRTGYGAIPVPEGGRLEERNGTAILSSGLPRETSLDSLPTPDWRLGQRRGEPATPMVYYESARGCPYRCAFCNYPSLFEDNRFRTKSAEKIASDWALYVEQGAEYITCLDSLFTMPKRRLVRLCELLIERKIDVKWICYARADDIKDLETCELMRRAGCIEVQIGLESGSQRILDNMNKRSTVAQNQRALVNCRKAGITTACTLIIGFPGENVATIQASLAMVRETPPDLCLPAMFNTRFERAPILEPAAAARFGLVSLRGGRSGSPYWRHDTMSSAEVMGWVRWFCDRMATERLSLDGAVFYGGMLGYDQAMREDLLDFQRDVHAASPALRAVVGRVDRWIQGRLERDIERTLPA